MRSEELRVVASNAEPARDLATVVRECGIEIVDATLDYPVGPYVKGSLKANLLRLFGHKGEGVAPQFVTGLSSISLTIAHGERIGLVGSNGSGKSTLLRALAGVYPLKSGTIRVQGVIGALLDISLGFESESTGRENIYYRGMAMGVSPSRIAKAEREIVTFADLGKFIDLPMRTYSAGMWVRLGFAISTQFAPDVLLLDEVFGAGDAAFAERAVRRMNRVVQDAGIVLIATHDLALIERICSRVLWLYKGQIVRDGAPQVVIPQYNDFVAGRISP